MNPKSIVLALVVACTASLAGTAAAEPTSPPPAPAVSEPPAPDLAEQKESWPELVGKSGDYARNAILSERPDLTVQLVRDGSFVTMDYRGDRVRVFIDKQRRVTEVPRVG